MVLISPQIMQKIPQFPLKIGSLSLLCGNIGALCDNRLIMRPISVWLYTDV